MFPAERQRRMSIPHLANTDEGKNCSASAFWAVALQSGAPGQGRFGTILPRLCVGLGLWRIEFDRRVTP